MKLRSIFAAVLVALCFCLAGCQTTAPTTKKQETSSVSNFVSKKIYVTTCGQAQYSDAECIITDDTDGLGLSATCSKTLAAADVEEGSIVVVIVAYTSKGMGGDVTQAGEEARCAAFCERANKDEISLIVFHIGGQTRRGAGTDGMLEDACEVADAIFAETHEPYSSTQYSNQGSDDLANWAGDAEKVHLFGDLYDCLTELELVLRTLDGQTR